PRGAGWRPRAGGQCPAQIIAVGTLARRLHPHARGGSAMKGILRFNAFAPHWRLRARSIPVVLSSALVLTVGIARAAEYRSPDVHGSHTTTVVDSGLLAPGAVTIGRGESVEFANYSSEAIEVVFTEPKDRADEVRCQVTRDPDRTARSGSTVQWPL